MDTSYAERSKELGGCTFYGKDGEVLYDPLYDVDETFLSKVDRLGLACCRLNSWKWDDFIGPKPDSFDALPEFDKRRFKRFRKPIRTKHDYLTPARRAIESEIGSANVSRCHWVYGMKRTEEEWREWYCSEFPGL